MKMDEVITGYCGSGTPGILFSENDKAK